MAAALARIVVASDAVLDASAPQEHRAGSPSADRLGDGVRVQRRASRHAAAESSACAGDPRRTGVLDRQVDRGGPLQRRGRWAQRRQGDARSRQLHALPRGYVRDAHDETVLSASRVAQGGSLSPVARRVCRHVEDLGSVHVRIHRRRPRVRRGAPWNHDRTIADVAKPRRARRARQNGHPAEQAPDLADDR